MTFSKLYKGKEGWKSTDRFDREDLLLVAEVARQSAALLYGPGPVRDEEADLVRGRGVGG